MRFFVFSPLIIYIHVAVVQASSQQTIYANTSSASRLNITIAPTPTRAQKLLAPCGLDCTLGQNFASRVIWNSIFVHGNVTAATVFVFVNNRTNTTKETTIYNTDLGEWTLPITNTAGTQVTTLTAYDYIARTTYTSLIAYPTEHQDYPYSFKSTKVVSTAVSGLSTCLRVTDNETTQVTSHPPLPPLDVPPTDPADPRGWAYNPGLIYPDCYEAPSFIGGILYEAVSTTVRYLTVTSTVQETAEGPFAAMVDPLSPNLAGSPTTTLSIMKIPSSDAATTPSTINIPVSPTHSTSSALLLFNVFSTGPTPSGPTPSSSSPSSLDQPPSSSAHSYPRSSISVRPNSVPQREPSTELTSLGLPHSKPVNLSPARPVPFFSALVSVRLTAVPVTAAPNVIIQRPKTSPQPQLNTIHSSAIQVSLGASPTVVVGRSIEVPVVVLGSLSALFGSTVSIEKIPVVVSSSSGSMYIVVGSSIAPLLLASTPVAQQPPMPIIVAGSTIASNFNSQYVVSGQTLAPGASITIGSGVSTTIIALQTSGSQTQLVVGGSTSLLSQASNAAMTVIPPPIVVGSLTFLAGRPTIPVSETPISMDQGATDVVVGSSTEGLGGYIASGIGAVSAGETGVAGFSVAAAKGRGVTWRLMVCGFGVLNLMSLMY